MLFLFPYYLYVIHTYVIISIYYLVYKCALDSEEGFLMRKNSFTNKILISLLSITMAIFLFTGCQSSGTSSQSKSASTSSTSKQTTSTENKTDNNDNMKEQMESDLKSLVTAGTITEEQSTKIIEALTTKPDSGKQNKPENNNQNNTEQPTQKNDENKPENGGASPLSKLVSSGTITQVQADAVMNKLKENSMRKGAEHNDIQSSN